MVKAKLYTQRVCTRCGYILPEKMKRRKCPKCGGTITTIYKINKNHKLKACKYYPYIICEYVKCGWHCPHYAKYIKQYIRYPIVVCVLNKGCRYRRTDKKLKIPICTYIDPKTKKHLPCNNQLVVSQNWLEKHKPDIQTLRKMWYKYKKAEVI